MSDLLRRWVKRLLRLPPQPEPPFGAPGSVRIFRAGPGFLQYRLLQWGARQLGAALGIAVVLVLSGWDPLGLLRGLDGVMEELRPLTRIPFSLSELLRGAELLAIFGFLIQFVYSLQLVLLDYEYRWYFVTDRSLRIREGLLRVEERTMTYSNIQNLSVHQGPVQRLFGISDLEVRTAGGGGNTSGDGEAKNEGLHVAHFRGISNPEEVRETIRKHLRTQRESGLGDPDEDPPASAQNAAQPSATEAARRALEEVRALRRAWRPQARS